MSSMTSLRIRAGLLAVAAFLSTTAILAVSAAPARAQAACCNSVTMTVNVPPDPPPATGTVLHYNLQSSCSSSMCSGSITMTTPPLPTTQSKCEQLVQSINTNPACVAAGIKVITPAGDQCAATSTFVATDVRCNCANETPGKGVMLLLSNAKGTGKFLQGAGWLPDYENDTIQGCGNVGGGTTNPGGSLVNLSGTPNVMPIVGGMRPSVRFDVFVPSAPGSTQGIHSFFDVFTDITPTPSAAQIVGMGVSGLNQQLPSLTAARCTLDPVNPTSFRCALTGSGSQEQDLPVTLQLNDTGLARFQGSGAAFDIFAVQNTLNNNGGISNVESLNVVSNAAPAVPAWGFLALAFVLAAGGVVLLKRRQGDLGPSAS